MVNTLEYIATKFNLDLTQRQQPIEILKCNRKIMAQILHELGFKIGAEIGVAQGDHALAICENIPHVKLYCVDVWDLYDGYNEYQNRIHRYHKEAVEKLRPYNCEFIQKFSMDAVSEFEDQSLDFVYIDAAHDFKNVAVDVCEWTKKVKIGGIVYGHDYKRRIDREHNVIQVKDVIQAYTYSNGVKPWFTIGEPSNRNDGMYKEGAQSWMFVRQERDLESRLQKLRKEGRIT